MPSETLIRPSSPPSLEALIAKYDGRAPRYTSYPTAVQFGPAVDPATYRAWLANLDGSAPVSLYAHIPFCARLCWYCGCNTRAVNGHDTIADYLDLLLVELDLLEGALPARMDLSAIHLGGGTPNTLTPEDLTRLFGAIRRVFQVAPEVEIAAELDPTSLTRDWVRAARSHGLTRASLGVQTLDARVQAAVNRPEPYEHIAACVGWLREAGITSINLDLMYGLPHQTTGAVLQTLDEVLGLAPERIALFGYAHVP